MIRLLSLNLQHGAPGAGAEGTPLASADITDPVTAREVLEALAEQIREIGPDVITLQEVDLGQRRSGRLDQAAELARLLGWNEHRFAATYAGSVTGLRRRPLRSRLTAPADDVLGPVRALLGQPPAGFGNALLTRLPVTAWRVQRLGRGPALVTRRGENAWDPRSYRVATSTMRNLISAEVMVPGDPTVSAGRHAAGPAVTPIDGFTVAATHLATRVDTAGEQLAAAWGALASLPGPHVLAGDLNLRTHQVAALGVAREVGTGDTYPARKPDHRIDHVLTDPWPVDADGRPLAEADAAASPRWAGEGRPLLRAVDSGTRTLVVSDHAGTWVDLDAVV